MRHRFLEYARRASFYGGHTEILRLPLTHKKCAINLIMSFVTIFSFIDAIVYLLLLTKTLFICP